MAKKALKLTPSGKELLLRIKKECAQYGVRLFIAKGETVKADGDKCSGYFDGDRKVIAVGSSSNETSFLSVLCHEYGHFCQWRDVLLKRRNKAALAWAAYQTVPHLWGKGVTKAQRWASYKALLAIEMDAEATSQKLLKLHNIGTPLERLSAVKAGALYLYCHRLMHDEGRWFKDDSPMTHWLGGVDGLWDALPNKIIGINFTKLSKKLGGILRPLF